MNYTITANIDKEIFLRFFHIATNIAILINKCIMRKHPKSTTLMYKQYMSWRFGVLTKLGVI